MATGALGVNRGDNYPEWYLRAVSAGDLAENSPVRGCMVIKPWGYALWENMQRALDGMFKATGHVNAYFPLFIPLSFLEKEAQHVEGFAKECAVVTHHRLEQGPDGKLKPTGALEEPLVVRPTSETIIGHMYSQWVQSWRDLPIKINQWANVVRWEMRTRLFLRTAEFLWQEGHTAHATAEEAWEETRLMLDVYADFAENYMAMPVIKGEKTSDERFPGADRTLSIEAMMQDGKALQAGTSHFLGQNFAKAQEIRFQDEKGVNQYAWTTSWGVSTRLVGALVMSHADDDGLILPPKLAPQQVVILPIYRKDEEKAQVLEYCNQLQQRLKDQRYAGEPVRVQIDDRDIRGGDKKWQHVKRGVPVLLEVGPKDIAKQSVFAYRRDTGEKAGVPLDEFVSTIACRLDQMQQGMFQKALDFRQQNTVSVDSLDDFRDIFKDETGVSKFVKCHFTDGSAEMAKILKEYAVTPRNIPLDEPEEAGGKCLFTGGPSRRRGVFGKSY